MAATRGRAFLAVALLVQVWFVSRLRYRSGGFVLQSSPIAGTLARMQLCDPSSAFFGFMGVTSAIVFANLGAAYGTAKSGVGISSMGVMRPDMVMRSIIPVVMAGVL